MMLDRAGVILALCLVSNIALAQEPDVLGRLSAGTPVFVQLAQPVSSKTAKRGDRFAIRLDKPLVVGEGVLVPAGSRGEGEVVSAARSKAGGQAGELVLAARYIEHQGGRIAVRGLKLMGVGSDSSKSTNWCKAILNYCPQTSTDIELPEGFVAEAKLAQDLVLPVISPLSPIATEPPIAPLPTEVP